MFGKIALFQHLHLHVTVKFLKTKTYTKIAKIVFSSLYEYVEENKPVSVHQSGFRSNDSRVNQLLSMFIQSF